MPRRASASPAAPVPFDPAAARAVRSSLGMSPAMVARALADSYALPAPPALVIAWETGAAHPDERELTALARVLWCLPGQLMGGRAASLRDYRLALDLPQEEVARRLRVSPRDYAQMELSWDGDRLQTTDLATILKLSPRALVCACGREERLDEILRRAVDGRWQSQVDPLLALVPTLSEDWIAYALKSLAGEKAAASALWGTTGPAALEARQSAEMELSDRFWLLIA
ncbi:transcriptional regulator with XRE-family HTH domain/DNA-binding transcriptional regulator YiaG [Streptacidiphilus sp. MAP12-20]|uniref:XRE family transcriptional regulator n=1 Tax=Streptacidiphilus sp. MAP12-20 TaxID=3156299 RepID=UPI00351569C0